MASSSDIINGLLGGVTTDWDQWFASLSDPTQQNIANNMAAAGQGQAPVADGSSATAGTPGWNQRIQTAQEQLAQDMANFFAQQAAAQANANGTSATSTTGGATTTPTQNSPVSGVVNALGGGANFFTGQQNYSNYSGSPVVDVQRRGKSLLPTGNGANATATATPLPTGGEATGLDSYYGYTPATTTTAGAAQIAAPPAALGKPVVHNNGFYFANPQNGGYVQWVPEPTHGANQSGGGGGAGTGGSM